MTALKKNIFFIFLFFYVFSSFSQEGTRTAKKNSSEAVRKIMIVPFDPKLYMSEIDFKINQQTKWNFAQIRENFRKQLNTQLKLKLQSIAPVVSFYSDSTKTAKDLAYIYVSTDLSYDLIEKKEEVKIPSTPQKGIKNGQLVVEVNTDKKFMNRKITDPKLLDYLTTKYKTDYFVFINQLDIKNDPDSYDLATDVYQREITVHYSIFDKNGKNISAGVATSHFSSKENEPKKIVSNNFSSIAAYITEKLSAAIKSEIATTQKNN